jgi:hypothetical protein
VQENVFGSKDNRGLVHEVRPVYPKQAKIARIQGVVKVEYVVTKTGRLEKYETCTLCPVIRKRPVNYLPDAYGDSVLLPATVAAVTQWRFAPCRVNGSEPVERRSQSDISFTLNQ